MSYLSERLLRAGKGQEYSHFPLPSLLSFISVLDKSDIELVINDAHNLPKVLLTPAVRIWLDIDYKIYATVLPLPSL